MVMAIDSRSLRIGNIVSDIHASETGMWRVEQLRPTICYYGEFRSRYENLRPVALSPSILLACGFDDKGSMKVTRSKRLSWSYGNDFWLENDEGDTLWEFENISSLHQLQNLILSLTGTELTITLPIEVKQ